MDILQLTLYITIFLDYVMLICNCYFINFLICLSWDDYI